MVSSWRSQPRARSNFGRQVGRLPVVRGRRHLDPEALGPVRREPARRRFEVVGGGRRVADRAGDLGDARVQLPVEAADHGHRQDRAVEPDRHGRARPPREQDGGEHRAAEEGAEADGVAAERVRGRARSGSRRAGSRRRRGAAGAPRPRGPVGEDQRAAAPERDRDEGGEDEGELARFGEGEVGRDGEDQRRHAGAEAGPADPPPACQRPPATSTPARKAPATGLASGAGRRG